MTRFLVKMDSYLLGSVPYHKFEIEWNGELINMKQFILDAFRISDRVAFGILVFVGVSFVSCLGYVMIQESSLRLPFDWLLFSYQKETSGGFSMQIDFTNAFLFAIFFAIVCMSLVILVIKKVLDTKKALRS